jgi:hypothetical protein
VLGIALLVANLATCGCGQAARTAGSPVNTRSTTTLARPSAGGYFEGDGDADPDDNTSKESNDNGDLLASYPGRPSEADMRAITAVVKSYYAAAAARDGAKACQLLDSSLAMNLGEGSGHSGAKGCVAAVDHLFKEEHQRLIADEVATMAVTSAHLKGEVGLALLAFKKAIQGEIIVEREGGMWKVDALIDGEVP